MAELGLKDSVTFLGYVGENELSSLYKNAVCFVFTSIYESFGIPILEAMACGTPVITSNLSSMPEIAGDAALTVNPYDVNEIAEAMEKVVSDSMLQQCLITNGLNRVENFSWENAAKQTLKVYEHIFRAKNNP